MKRSGIEETHFKRLVEILPVGQNDMGGAAFFCCHFLLVIELVVSEPVELSKYCLKFSSRLRMTNTGNIFFLFK